MPYAHALQQYTEAGFFREPPPEWERRLREISPVTSHGDHLVFRWFDADPSWNCPERGQWALYTAKPIALVTSERAGQFARHWSELPLDKQAGRQAMVSNYQHYMWHARGLYVKPFLILQGPWGGTPAKYTEREIAFLQASDCLDEPFPIGSFPACPFDERTVETITKRDRLLQCANDYDAVAKLDTPEGMKAEETAAQRLKRETFLDTWRVMIQPSVEFMQSFLRTKEADRVLPRAPEGTTAAVAQWRDHWIEHGSILNANVARSRRVQVAVR